MNKTKSSDPIKFLDAANMDPGINEKVQQAMEKGALMTVEEIMKIARSAGFEFSKEEFESAVRRNMEERFASGEIGLADVAAKRRPKPPESSCAKGCLSYTKSWHPRAFFAYEPQAKD
jgi:hypothetical protein